MVLRIRAIGAGHTGVGKSTLLNFLLQKDPTKGPFEVSSGQEACTTEPQTEDAIVKVDEDEYILDLTDLQGFGDTRSIEEARKAFEDTIDAYIKNPEKDFHAVLQCIRSGDPRFDHSQQSMTRAFLSVLRNGNEKNLFFVMTKHEMNKGAEKTRILETPSVDSEEEWRKERREGILEQIRKILPEELSEKEKDEVVDNLRPNFIFISSFETTEDGEPERKARSELWKALAQCKPIDRDDARSHTTRAPYQEMAIEKEQREKREAEIAQMKEDAIKTSEEHEQKLKEEREKAEEDREKLEEEHRKREELIRGFPKHFTNHEWVDDNFVSRKETGIWHYIDIEVFASGDVAIEAKNWVNKVSGTNRYQSTVVLVNGAGEAVASFRVPAPTAAGDINYGASSTEVKTFEFKIDPEVALTVVDKRIFSEKREGQNFPEQLENALKEGKRIKNILIQGDW